jgi:hypothetical protein
MDEEYVILLTCLDRVIWLAVVVAFFMLVYAAWQVMRSVQRLESTYRRVHKNDIPPQSPQAARAMQKLQDLEQEES